MKILSTIIFFMMAGLARASDTAVVISGIHIHFSETRPGKLIRVSNYQPVKNDSMIRVTVFYLQRFMEKYPPLVLQHMLKDIYICNGFNYAGAAVGGVGCAKGRYLVMAVSQERMQVKDYWYWMERLFHHELSHVIFGNAEHLFDKKDWKKQNATGYTGHPNRRLRKGTPIGMVLDTNQLKQGFLSEYGASSLREDVAVFSEFMFTAEPGLYAYLDAYDRSRRKFRLMAEFYAKTDALFSETYFRNLKPAMSVENRVYTGL